MKPDTKSWYDLLVEHDQKLIKLYKAKEEHLSPSSFRRFRESPLEFLEYKLRRSLQIDDKTEAMNEGNLIHMLMLERHKLEERYWVFDDTKKVEELSKKYKNVRGSKEYKDWRDALFVKHKGKEQISKQLLEKAKTAFKIAMCNKDFLLYLRKIQADGLKHEFKFKTSTLAGGYPVRGIMDMTSNRHIADLKWLSNISDYAINKHYWGEATGVARQQAIYAASYGFGKTTTMIFMGHNGDVRLREVPKEVLEFSYQQYASDIKRFDECVNEHGTFIIGRDFWTEPEFRKISIPQWAFPEDE